MHNLKKYFKNCSNLKIVSYFVEITISFFHTVDGFKFGSPQSQLKHSFLWSVFEVSKTLRNQHFICEFSLIIDIHLTVFLTLKYLGLISYGWPVVSNSWLRQTFLILHNAFFHGFVTKTQGWYNKVSQGGTLWVAQLIKAVKVQKKN